MNRTDLLTDLELLLVARPAKGPLRVNAWLVVQCPGLFLLHARALNPVGDGKAHQTEWDVVAMVVESLKSGGWS